MSLFSGGGGGEKLLTISIMCYLHEVRTSVLGLWKHLRRVIRNCLKSVMWNEQHSSCLDLSHQKLFPGAWEQSSTLRSVSLKSSSRRLWSEQLNKSQRKQIFLG